MTFCIISCLIRCLKPLTAFLWVWLLWGLFSLVCFYFISPSTEQKRRVHPYTTLSEKNTPRHLLSKQLNQSTTQRQWQFKDIITASSALTGYVNFLRHSWKIVSYLPFGSVQKQQAGMLPLPAAAHAALCSVHVARAAVGSQQGCACC